MLINTLASAVAPQADAGFDAADVTQPLAGFGPGTVVRERSWNAVGGFAPCGIDAARLTQARLAGVKGSTVQISSIQNTAVQHDTDQMTRQYPATGGGVGPHPAREPVPV